MGSASNTFKLHNLYELSWTYAPGSMFALDCDAGTIVNANPAAVKLSGYSRDELIGMSLSDLHPEAEREHFRSLICNAEAQPLNDYGFSLLCKDSRHKRVEISFSDLALLNGHRVKICVYFDISEPLEQKHQLSTQNWALSAYAGAALALGRAEVVKELKQSICEAITSNSVYALAWIGIAENDPQKTIRIAAAAGSGIAYADGIRVSWSEDDPQGCGPTGVCIRTGKTVILEDSDSAEFFAPWRERARSVGIRSLAAIPFSIEAGRLGALMVYSRHPNAFEPSAIEVFEHLAMQIGHGIHAIEREQLLQAEQSRLEMLQRQLNDALSAMVSPIVTAMEMRDPYTSGHQSRVAEIAVAIGREMGWTEERLQGLRIAALVHDIGKISIPEEILTKPGQRTASDRRIIHGHPETGYRILQDVPLNWPIAEIVRQHHEKLDGSGYPFGLKGSDILPEARILAVADILEAMASDRPYRPAIELETVLAELETQAGRLLDEEAVRVCITLVRQKRLVLPSENRR
jgi:PAS domain S-box-containing protein/putative nucleotidyltransferase with HDIG domain